MAQWKPLPDSLAPQSRALVVRLRELKDQLGVSTSALARKTQYSRSSWERCLNGRTLPPRHAVAALGQLAGVDPVRLLALWEFADQADKLDRARLRRLPGQDPEPPTDPPRDVDPPRRHWWRPRLLAATTVGIALLVTLGVLVWPTIGRAGSEPGSTAKAALLPGGYGCDFSTRGGRWYAGHSTTDDRLVGLNVGGQDVVEVQCLLKHHGLDPGRIDGMFGRHTEKAVEQLQSSGATTVDGVVGPQTWALLRR